MSSKGENRYLGIEARAKRGYGANLADTRFLLRIIEGQEDLIKAQAIELRDTQKDLGKIRKDPLTQLERQGWIRKWSWKRFCILVREKEGRDG